MATFTLATALFLGLLEIGVVWEQGRLIKGTD